MKNQILILSSATDATTTFLCEKLFEKRIPFIRFDIENFPNSWHINWEINPYMPTTFIGEQETINLDSVKSVWFRRPGTPSIDPAVTELSAREFAVKECEVSLSAVWQDLDVLWVNHPRSIMYATRKPHQLKTAKKLGFNIPATILSNDPKAIKDFWLSQNKSVVFKTLHQDAIEIDGVNFFAYASLLKAHHLNNTQSIAISPSLFQQYIKPKLELRVTVIGEKVFAAAIDSKSVKVKTDWRRISPDKQKWFIFDLPKELEQKCIALVKGYNLEFGAIDLIISEDDDVYFLELNANGQWVWIELITGLEMSKAMIELLSSENFS